MIRLYPRMFIECITNPDFVETTRDEEVYSRVVMGLCPIWVSSVIGKVDGRL